MRARLLPASLGDSGPDVAWAQVKLGISPADGVFDGATVARVRGLQLTNRLATTGELDQETIECLIRLK